MGYRFAQARTEAGLTLLELAEKLGVTKATVSNWETGQRQPALERLTQISGILGVSIAYLLGADEQVAWTEPIDIALLYVMHSRPVWIKSRGWALVNIVEKSLVFADKSSLCFDAVNEPVYAVPPAFALGLHGIGTPLDLDRISSMQRVWVEPITPDTELGAELRGWYKLKDRLVQNEYGNRFYLDTYGVKWLAFKDCLD
jgi:transcriptional regulator with XRE-family HTH domain